jgi:hypothetical protein
MNHFKGISTLDELKQRYKMLAKVFHPDMPNGNTEIMQEINNQYDKLFPMLKNKVNKEADAEHQTTEMADDYKNIITALMKLEHIQVELCGSWLWISNKMDSNEILLKKAGCGYSKNKGLWYWRPSGATHHGKSGASIDHIRTKYGSESVWGTKTKAKKPLLV